MVCEEEERWKTIELVVCEEGERWKAKTCSE